MKIVSDEYCEDETEKSEAITSAVLLKNPNLAGAFGVNLYASLGVASAVENNKKNIPIF